MHWYENFYPQGLPKNKLFGFYQEYFDTVELNSTFYHLPKETVVENWNARAKNDFVYSVKMWRRITHLKRLNDVSADLALFFSKMSALEKKTGIYLVQLPPLMRKDIVRLEELLDNTKDKKLALEFRNETWFSDDVYHILEKRNKSFCIADMPDLKFPKKVTADYVYIRLHGFNTLYSGRYPDEELRKWADFVQTLKAVVKEVFIYFNNDFEGNAVKDALRLKEILNEYN